MRNKTTGGLQTSTKSKVHCNPKKHKKKLSKTKLYNLKFYLSPFTKHAKIGMLLKSKLALPSSLSKWKFALLASKHYSHYKLTTSFVDWLQMLWQWICMLLHLQHQALMLNLGKGTTLVMKIYKIIGCEHGYNTYNICVYGFF